MKLLPLTIAALGPLAFPERKPGVQFRTSLPYVPGPAIYGALGALLSTQLDQDAFAALFRSIRCHNAYPALEGDAWVRPLPMTAIQPKGGTATKDGVTAHNPYVDSLYARVCWERQQPAALIYAPTDNDGRPWEAAGRMFYTHHAATGIGTRATSQRVLTRVAINRRRGTAEDSRLYSPLVISEAMEDQAKRLVPTRFVGSVAVPDDDTQVIDALGRIDYLGGRQTSGIGAVHITPQPATDAEEHSAQIKERVAAMTVRFKQQANFFAALGGKQWEDGDIFTINLLSDAILLDQGWLPTNQISKDMLHESTNINAKLLRSFTTTSTVGGWNVSWQRPKHTAVATNMGSVFVFRADRPLTNEDYQQLAALERTGIGERRAEGYGHVRICDDFHLLSEEAV